VKGEFFTFHLSDLKPNFTRLNTFFMASKGNTTLVEQNPVPTSAFKGSVIIVRTQWNAEIVDKLESGCKEVLSKNGFSDVHSITVPGAVEITFAIKNYWEKMKYRDNRPAVFIALGCVIKGGTPHFDYVCKAVTDGIVQLNLILPIPTIFGVLTLNNEQEALERTGGIHGHKGEEAALTAIAMISLIESYKNL
jgi:6,7-dimethyl-8-ribityllumazine synthase